MDWERKEGWEEMINFFGSTFVCSGAIIGIWYSLGGGEFRSLRQRP